MTDIRTQFLASHESLTGRLIAMGRMTSSVTHELNQPLTAITNYCSSMIALIKNRQASEEALLIMLEKTSYQAQRAGHIIQCIHKFMKAKEPNRTPTSVAKIVEEAIELTQFALQQHNVQLSSHVAKQLPLVMVDSILIEQMLINLFKNAIESIDQAGRLRAQRCVTLHVDPCRQDNVPGINFSVQDTGTGLKREVRDQLCTAFFSTKHEGMGIGLNLCHSIVESHQGSMQVENIYNSRKETTGCRFTIWIPITKPTNDTANNKRGTYEPEIKKMHHPTYR